MSFLKSMAKKVLIFGAPVATYFVGLKRSEEHVHQFTDLLAKSADPKAAEVAVYTFPPSIKRAGVTAYLDYHGIPYTNVYVNPLTKEQLVFSREYKKAPIALISGAQVNDSNVIVETLAKRNFSKTDAATLKIIDDEVVPALYATVFDSFENINAFLSDKPVFFRGVMTVFSPFMAYVSKKRFADAFDTEKLLPALTKAFTAVGNQSTPLPSELALFGALRC
eukprot:gene9039-13992_t